MLFYISWMCSFNLTGLSQCAALHRQIRQRAPSQNASAEAVSYFYNVMKSWLALFAAFAIVQAQTASPGGVAKSLSEVKFEPDSDVKCLLSAVESGNPDTGPSTIILKSPANCLVPWHYHTAGEQLIVTQGNVKTEMDGMAAHVLGPGGFAEMPGKVKHQFVCESTAGCVMFVSFDRKYDIFWVKPAKTK